MSFTPEEITYLASQSLARLATVTAGGQPDVVPVASSSTARRSGSEAAANRSCRPGRSATWPAATATSHW